MSPTKEEYEEKLTKLHKLIKGKGRHLTDKYCEAEHKNLSHYPKEVQEAFLRGAEMALMDRLIMYLSGI